jgi:hypothetical protein
MKTSELINKLQKSLENDGDLEVYIPFNEGSLLKGYRNPVIPNIVETRYNMLNDKLPAKFLFLSDYSI